MKPLYKLAAQFLVPILMLSSAYSASREELGLVRPDKIYESKTSFCPKIPNCISIIFDTDGDGYFDWEEYYWRDELPSLDEGELNEDPFFIWKDLDGNYSSYLPNETMQREECFVRDEYGNWMNLEEAEKEIEKRLIEIEKRRHGI